MQLFAIHFTLPYHGKNTIVLHMEQDTATAKEDGLIISRRHRQHTALPPGEVLELI